MVEENPLMSYGARHAAVSSLDLIIKAGWYSTVLSELEKLGFTVCYSNVLKRNKPRRVRMDVESLVDKWLGVLVGLSTAHTHAEYTAADYQTDELLGPLLVAPIAQIREFGQRLATRLREDPRVPFLVWAGFQRLIEPVILKGADSELITLKKRLATEIAERVEGGLDRTQLVEALAGALQWRSAEALTSVSKSLDSGAKPRLRGRESCLFLEVGDAVVVV